MNSTELTDIKQALQVVERMVTRGGFDGEHLVPPSQADDGESASLAQRRLALRKSLLAASNLLTVAHRLLEEPENLSSRELSLRTKASIEKLKLAARSAYEAGHLLIGVRARPRS